MTPLAQFFTNSKSILLNSLKNKLKKSIMRKRSVLYMNMAVMKRLNRQGLLIAGLHLLVLLNLAADFLYAS